MARSSTPVADQSADVAAWVSSPEAAAAARRELARVGFPDPALGADDLLQAVAERVLVRLARGPLDGDGGVEAYLRRSLRNRAIDVFTSARARTTGSLLGAGDDGPAHEAEPTAVAPDDLDGRADDLRGHLLADADDGPAWVLSGALTFVSLAAEPGLLDAARSRPPDAGGVRRRMMWAAVDYSGHGDDLPGARGEDDDPARRKRRSRRVAAIDAALARAGAASVEADR